MRIWHWVMALCMVVLAITGYLIGSPPPSLGGEASEHFMFGYIRFAHFAAGIRVRGDLRAAGDLGLPRQPVLARDVPVPAKMLTGRSGGAA